MRVRRQNQAILQPGLQLSAPDREVRIFIHGAEPTANQAEQRRRDEKSPERPSPVVGFLATRRSEEVQHGEHILKASHEQLTSELNHERHRGVSGRWSRCAAEHAKQFRRSCSFASSPTRASGIRCGSIIIVVEVEGGVRFSLCRYI